jgi:hypothetical protein
MILSSNAMDLPLSSRSPGLGNLIAPLARWNSWYKGKAEVGPPPQTSIQVAATSIQVEETDQQEQEVPDQETQVKTKVKKAGNIRKKKRGTHKGSITLGGLKKVEKALKRKAKSKIRKKLGEMSIPEGRKEKRGRGPLAPIRSMVFMGGLLFDSPWAMGDPSPWAMGDQSPSTGVQGEGE